MTEKFQFDCQEPNGVAQVSKPAVSPISKSANREKSGDGELETSDAKPKPIWNRRRITSYDQRVCKPAIQQT